METKNYVCPKCQNKSYELDKFSATGGFLSKMFDVQTKEFTTITCEACKYTEIYKATASELETIFDFLLS